MTSDSDFDSSPPPVFLHQQDQLTEDGSLIIKSSSSPLEVAFYQRVGTESSFEALRLYVPKLYGMLKLEGRLADDQNTVEALGVNEEGKDNQPGDKLILVSWSLVIENVWHTFTKPLTLKVDIGTSSTDLDDKSLSTPRFEIFADSFNTTSTAFCPPEDAISQFLPLEGSLLPTETLLPILEEILLDLHDARDALSELDIRLDGASLAIVYESDLDRAQAGLELLEEFGGFETTEDDDDDDDEDGTKNPPCIVKILNFAQTRFVPSEGPDACALGWFDLVIRLIEARSETIESSTTY